MWITANTKGERITLTIILIRHGRTYGNVLGKYIGKTDEELYIDGMNELTAKEYPQCDLVFSSPMRRCLESAKIIYPQKKPFIIKDFEEMDFGDFEGRTYEELNGNKDYQAWIDSGGMIAMPNGEARADFSARCVKAFDDIVKNASDNATIAFIVHGGTIMSILERYAEPKGDYYDFMVENASGYICDYNAKTQVANIRGKI